MYVRALGCTALLVTLLAAVPAAAQSGARRYDPCIDRFTPYWMQLDWVSAQDGAPRDGLLWTGTLEAGLSGRAEQPGDPRAISITVGDENGPTAGTVDIWNDAKAKPIIAWRPNVPLHPDHTYTVDVVLDNRAGGCKMASHMEQSYSITTAAELSAPPPVPPLRELVYAHAWFSLPSWSCCVPRDTSDCTDPTSCYACWQQSREPILVSLFDGAPSASVDPLHYALVFGRNAGGRQLTSWAPQVPVGVFRPLLYPDLGFSSDATEVCVTAVTRNFRTGQLSTQTRCDAPVDDTSISSADLTLMLGPMASVSAPADPGIHIRSSPCATGAPHGTSPDEIEHAVSYFAERLDCSTNPACAMEQAAARGAAGSLAPATTTPIEIPRKSRRHDDGCSAGTSDAGSADAFSCAALLFAVTFVRRRIAATHRSRAAHRRPEPLRNPRNQKRS